MDDTIESSLPPHILQPLMIASNSSTLVRALERLTEIARATDGRSELASGNVLAMVLELCQSLSYPSCRYLLLLSLRLLRNLSAGEINNQNSFIEQNGVAIVSAIFNSVKLCADSDFEIVRAGLQVLGNVSLGGEKHQRAVWNQLFPLDFLELARIQSKGTCDPLCMIIYACLDGNHGLIADLCSDQGFPIVAEIIRTASAVAFGEDWFKLILSRICLDEHCFLPLFSMLSLSDDCHVTTSKADLFEPEQAFLLSNLSDILNERISDLNVFEDFALCIFGIFRKAVEAVDYESRGQLGLPTGSTDIDVLGYSLTILRDICACDSLGGFKEDDSVDVVGLLFSSGFLELLLNLLSDLEPPSIIRKALRQGESEEGTSSSFSGKRCPYRGFRRDLVAAIGNCVYRRKHAQDWIRENNRLLVLLQQCVIDDDNPLLREWAIWAVRNALEGNEENQLVVRELELQGSVDVPDITLLGLKVVVDPETRRAKLVNTS